jgi:hypothetical protein
MAPIPEGDVVSHLVDLRKTLLNGSSHDTVEVSGSSPATPTKP